MLIYKDCIEDMQELQYVCDPCEITEGGGVRSLCLLKKGTTIPNPYTQLDIDILVGAGLMHVMAETRGSFDGGTPKMITGYGDNKERQIGSDYVLQVKDPIFADNYEFWESVEKIEDWNIAFRTETQIAVVSDDVTITTKAPAEEGIDTEVVWDIECKWFSKNKPAIQPYSGKFDTILKTLDVIYGGTISNGGAVKLSIDAGKVGYIRLPNGTILTTVSGVINTTYSGVGGAITYYVPKNSAIAEFDSINITGITGDIITNFEGECRFSSQIYITGVTANKSTIINCSADAALTKLIAPKVITLYVSGCALTAKSIGDILYAAVADNRANVVYNFSGGTNADDVAIMSYITSTYPEESFPEFLTDWMDATLRANGGDITYN
jgi:hypothetical protein